MNELKAIDLPKEFLPEFNNLLNKSFYFIARIKKIKKYYHTKRVILLSLSALYILKSDATASKCVPYYLIKQVYRNNLTMGLMCIPPASDIYIKFKTEDECLTATNTIIKVYKIATGVSIEAYVHIGSIPPISSFQLKRKNDSAIIPIPLKEVVTSRQESPKTPKSTLNEITEDTMIYDNVTSNVSNQNDCSSQNTLDDASKTSKQILEINDSSIKSEDNKMDITKNDDNISEYTDMINDNINTNIQDNSYPNVQIPITKMDTREVYFPSYTTMQRQVMLHTPRDPYLNKIISQNHELQSLLVKNTELQQQILHLFVFDQMNNNSKIDKEMQVNMKSEYQSNGIFNFRESEYIPETIPLFNINSPLEFTNTSNTYDNDKIKSSIEQHTTNINKILNYINNQDVGKNDEGKNQKYKYP